MTTLVRARSDVDVRDQVRTAATFVRGGIAAVLVCWMALELAQDPRWQVAVPHALALLVALPARQLTIVVAWCATTLGVAVILEERWPLAVLSSAILATGALLDSARAQRAVAVGREQ